MKIGLGKKPPKSIEDKLEEAQNSADVWASTYRGISWILAFFLAGLGVLVASEAELEDWSLTIGCVSAGLAALQKGVEPAKRAEWHTTRKRALELIQIEVKRPPSDPSPLTPIKLERFACHTKIDPTQVLEDLAAVFAAEDKLPGNKSDLDGITEPKISNESDENSVDT